MNRDDIDKFEKLRGQIESVYNELSLLSKKSPNDAVNEFKLRFVNHLLGESNDLLGNSYLPFPDFTQFDEDALPSNSDAVFIMSQYLESFKRLREDNVSFHSGALHWVFKGTKTDGADDQGNVYIRVDNSQRVVW